MDNNDEIKNEDVEVIIEEEVNKVEEPKKVEEKREEYKCHTKMLDNWLFFCFDILLLIFVLGISIFILDMRESIKVLNHKADRIEQHYGIQEEEIVEDVEEGEPEEIVETTVETTEETTETVETTDSTIETTETVETTDSTIETTESAETTGVTE